MNAPIGKFAVAADLASGMSGLALVLPDGFMLDDGSLSYCKSGSNTPVRIAGAFGVRGLARDPNGHSWSVLPTWNDQDGKPHLQFLLQAGLIVEGADVFRTLVSA